MIGLRGSIRFAVLGLTVILHAGTSGCTRHPYVAIPVPIDASADVADLQGVDSASFDAGSAGGATVAIDVSDDVTPETSAPAYDASLDAGSAP